MLRSHIHLLELINGEFNIRPLEPTDNTRRLVPFRMSAYHPISRQTRYVEWATPAAISARARLGLVQAPVPSWRNDPAYNWAKRSRDSGAKP